MALLNDEAVFYAEQWVALTVGGGCLAAALWAGVHDCARAALPHRFSIAGQAFLLLIWSLTIASSLIGVVLLRFAFRGRSQEKKTPEEDGDEVRVENHGVIVVSDAARATGSGGGE